MYGGHVMQVTVTAGENKWDYHTLRPIPIKCLQGWWGKGVKINIKCVQGNFFSKSKVCEIFRVII